MKNNALKFLIAFTGILAVVTSCGKDDEVYTNIPIENEPESPVLMNLDAVPYAALSEYKFFEGDLKELNPSYKVIPYDLNSELFTDYALKKRFVWMPKGTTATYTQDGAVPDFPIGTALIKNFYYTTVNPGNSTRVIESRVLIRKSSGWIFADYVWNADQTEAILDTDGETIRLSWMQDGTSMLTNYKVPSEDKCVKCHQLNENPVPIGVKPQNINKSFAYADGAMNQLSKWISVGYLNVAPTNIASTINWQDGSQSPDARVGSYLDINCAHCHSPGTSCDDTPMDLRYTQTTNPSNIGLCVAPVDFVTGNQQYIVAGGDVEGSLMHFRMSTNIASEMMPTLGRTVVHQEALELMEEWIATQQSCE